jgi:hypothetical protein
MFESVQPGNIGTPQYRKCADVVWPNFLEFLPLSPTDAPGRIDLRTAPQPDADALIDLAARALSEGQLPTESGERPQVVLTISPPGTARPNRLSPTGAGWTDQHRYHPPTRPRRRIIPVVLGSRGEPLDVARATRTVPTAIRRDGGCAFPGCSVPARWCDIHHIIHWVDHGPTSLNNCVALCSRHHRLLHHSHWQIHMVSGIPQFHPPPWLDGTTHQPPPYRPQPDPNPPVVEDSCAHVPPSVKGNTVGSDIQWSGPASETGNVLVSAKPTPALPL